MSNIGEAPEPTLLKRKRSRPSDWWAAPISNSNAPESSPQQDQSPPKKRGRRSVSGVQPIHEAPAAANRGDRRKSVSQKDTENAEGGDEGGEVVKTVRRGRSSNTEAELEAVATAELAAEIKGANEGHHGRPAQRNNWKETTKLGRGRLTNTKTEVQIDALDAAQNDAAPRKKRANSAVVGVEDDEFGNEPVDNASKGAKKRGRQGWPAVSQNHDELVNDPADAGIVKKNYGRPRPVARAEAQTETPCQGEGPSQSPPDEKKSGRPRSVSRAEEQPPDPPYNDQAKEASTLLRHGRSPNTQEELLAVVEMTTELQPEGKKRGRRPKPDDRLRAGVESPPASKGDAPAKPLRRSRSSNTQTEVRAIVESSVEEQLSQKNRGKASNTEVEAAADASITQVMNKKRRRHFDVNITESAAATSSTQDHTRRKRREGKETSVNDKADAAGLSVEGLVERRGRGRRSDTIVEIETATSSFARHRNASKKVDHTSEAANVKAKKDSSASQESSRSKKRQQPSNTEIQQNIESQSRGKTRSSIANAKRNRNQERVEYQMERESEEEAALQTDTAPSYQHLAPVTRRVSRQTIEAKWEPLPPAGVERISQIVHEVQRAVAVHFNDDKRMEANTALHMLSRRLISKVTKGLPFPPPMHNNREDDFDFEKILDHNRALELQLTPALHASELLESELGKEKMYLESEQASLMELEANAKSEASLRKDARRRLHSLLQSESMINEDATENTFGVVHPLHNYLPFSHTEDEDLQDIAQALIGHLHTIQGNINNVEGISQAMKKSGGALQATLFDHLESDEYEKIVLG